MFDLRLLDEAEVDEGPAVMMIQWLILPQMVSYRSAGVQFWKTEHLLEKGEALWSRNLIFCY